MARAPAVFALYRDSPLRRAALAAPPGSVERYSLFGLDELAAEGFPVGHNLDVATPPGSAARALGAVANRTVHAAGGYGGDFASVLASRRRLAASDVVYSTVDTVGIPFVMLRRFGLVGNRPFVYTSIGLLDRVVTLRRARVRDFYRDAVAAAGAVIAYGHGEAEDLRAWLAPAASPPPVHFVPFGVDTQAFVPTGRPPTTDVVSVGADPHRDYALIVAVARRTPGVSYRLVADRDTAPSTAPVNVQVEVGVPFAAASDALSGARIVALPVRDNAYSGATTVLLQALALAKPVVVSRTKAIEQGYGLVDGENCRLVPPGDAGAFERAVLDLLADPAGAAELARRGRAHVEESLSWDRYAATIRDVLLAVAGQLTA